ncbi:MAG: 16S rRNA (cytidine(1402)-2'-O)-methyltransferase [Pelagibacterales bacterium]|nr:16S rRNA (cytidine(1402)-2'-O)-methyltransferase [Pelagibacterales bacterium]
MQDFSPINSFFSEQKIENALYVVATPIGNLADITLRALNILQKSDFIVCEDSRITSRLLNHYKIKDKKLIVYNDHADQKNREKILNFLIQGNSIALVSDAGTPLISDPGYKLVCYVRQYNQKVIPIPGASSVVSALCTSGLACDNFLFLGFLPATKIQRSNLLKSLSKNYTSVFFDSPNRILASLNDISEIFPERKIAVAKELTKLHEEIISGKAIDVIEFFENNPQKVKGEFVLIIEKAAKEEKNLTQDQLEEEIKSYFNKGFSIKELSQNLSDIYELNKKDVYQLALKVSKDKN